MSNYLIATVDSNREFVDDPSHFQLELTDEMIVRLKGYAAEMQEVKDTPDLRYLEFSLPLENTGGWMDDWDVRMEMGLDDADTLVVDAVLECDEHETAESYTHVVVSTDLTFWFSTNDEGNGTEYFTPSFSISELDAEPAHVEQDDDIPGAFGTHQVVDIG